MTSQAYRLERLTNFVDPWADQYGAGYQLSQALIAFGRGEWLGVGLGNSIQKQFYLPEAHTDFVFAVLAEELGMVGALITVGLFVFVAVRALYIGLWAEKAKQFFAAYVAYGIAIQWIGQVLINIGVNVGLLPTKGLTLPFLSYGGTSLIICCVSLAMLLRIEWERRNVAGQRGHRIQRSRTSSTPRRSSMRGNVLIMAGGTGGHVFPALACAREFQARGYAVHWLGTPRGIENELVPAAGPAAAPDPGQRPARQGQAVAAQGAVPAGCVPCSRRAV